MGAKPEPTRVLHVIPGLGLGGAEAVLFRLISGSCPEFEHEVACLGGRGPYSDRLEQMGVTVHHLGGRWSLLGAASRLTRVVRVTKPALIQCWMYRANLIGGLAGRMADVPAIWNIRSSSFDPFGPGQRLLVRLSGALAGWLPDFIINCSAESRELHRRIGYERAPGTVIANGYDPTLFAPDPTTRMKMRQLLRIDDTTFLLGTISRWDSFKDIPTLLRALRCPADRKLPVHCLMIGTGLESANADLAAAIAEAGCEQLVTLLGPKQGIADLAQALDLHVLASISEGFPNAVAETMLSSVPNAVTDVGASRLIVGNTGWVVPAGDPAALAGAIAQACHEWAESPIRWAERKRTARDRIVDNFSLNRMIEAYQDVWRRFAQRKPAG